MADEQQQQPAPATAESVTAIDSRITAHEQATEQSFNALAKSIDERFTALEETATTAAPVVDYEARFKALEDGLAQLRADVSKRVAHLGS